MSGPHGDPVELETMRVPVCQECYKPYRWSQATGQRTREPYGPCSGLKRSGGGLQRTGGKLQRRGAGGDDE